MESITIYINSDVANIATNIPAINCQSLTSLQEKKL